MESSLIPELEVGTSSSLGLVTSPRRRFIKNIQTQRASSPFALGSVLVEGQLVDAGMNQTSHSGICEVYQRPTALKVGDEDRLREEFGIPL